MTSKTTASERYVDPTVRVSTDLLREASRLCPDADADTVVRRALEEFIERQRFLSWVAAHEDS
ncbi:MAG: hypothetical protein RMA76_44540 [Deltaproteobacteria bacterium]